VIKTPYFETTMTVTLLSEIADDIRVRIKSENLRNEVVIEIIKMI